MTYEEYINDPEISQKAKDAAIQVMDGPDTPAKRWLMARFKMRAHVEKKGNLFDGTKYET